MRGVGELPKLFSFRDQVLHRALRREKVQKLRDLEFTAMAIAVLTRSATPVESYRELKENMLEQLFKVKIREAKIKQEKDKLAWINKMTGL